MRVLITAGPTREHWDRVRFLSSGSTGRMGIEVARAAAAAGHEVVLVLGPTHVAPPDDPAITVVRVTSAREMLAACEEAWPRCDALVATAAVADYRPAEQHEGKRTKTDGPVTLELVRNPDILATLARSKADRPVIGFALQVEDAETHARRKLAEKHLDWIVLNGPASMGADAADFRILGADDTEVSLMGESKAALAARLVTLLGT